LPRTDTFGFRFSAVDNHFVTAATLGAELWKASRAIDQENAEKRLCQQTFAVPFIPTDVELAPLDPEQVRQRTAALKKGQLPEQCQAVAVGIDTGKRRLHWTAIAAGVQRHIVEYGEQPTRYDELGTRPALVEALHAIADYLEQGWIDTQGKRQSPAQVWIDSGYYEHTDAVYTFCLDRNARLKLPIGQERYRPSKGYGVGDEFAGRYIAPKAVTSDVRYLGHGYHLSQVPRAGQLLVHVDADLWKSELHDGLSVPADDGQAIVLYDAPSPTEHQTFAVQLAAEEREEKFIENRGVVRKWKRLRRANHYLDASYNAAAALDLILSLQAERDARAAHTRPATPPRFTTPDGQPYLITERMDG